MAALEPFRVDVPADVLDDRTERLRRTRFPNEVAGIGWRHGMPLDARAFFRPLRQPSPC